MRLLSGCILIAACIIALSNRYAVSSGAEDQAFIVDSFTGRLWKCEIYGNLGVQGRCWEVSR